VRYEARGKVVYDTEEGEVVSYATSEDEAKVAAYTANKREREHMEFESLMRNNRSVCG
jgi:hypothetical protein